MGKQKIGLQKTLSVVSPKDRLVLGQQKKPDNNREKCGKHTA